MFTPKSGSGFPSSASGRALASGGRRRASVGGLGLAGGRATPRSPYATPSGRNTPTLGTPSSSSLSQFSVESFGSALPALVKEALTFSEKSCEMSAVLSSCGWAWLVVGRRLLVWRYTAGTAAAARSSRGSSSTEFRELLLPQSDLAHRAQLVVLRQPDSSQLPSCMAVSPEGSVRYWHSIANESSYTEVSTELQGQECDCLVYLSGRLGYFLTTTTSTCLLLLPAPSPRSGDPGVSVRLVKPPAGLLGGLSRRVTSLMFGSLPTQAPEARLVRVVCRSSSADTVEVLVLSAEHLQCWQLTAGSSTDTLLYQAPLLHLLKQALAAKMLSGSVAAPPGATATPGGAGTKGANGVWVLDAQPQPHAPHQLAVLVAALSPARPNEVTLALAVVESSRSPECVVSMTVVQHSEPPLLDPLGGGDDTAPPAPLLHYRLLIASSTAYIHTPSSVVAVPCSDATIALSCRVPLPAAGDRLLGAGRLKGRALFFAASHGIVALSPPGTAFASPAVDLDYLSMSEAAEEAPTAALSLATASGGEGGSAYGLQEAFLLYSHDDCAAAQALLESEYPQGGGAQLQALPDAALALSRKILDDIPATDPRWAEAGGGGAPGTFHSLIITNQIRDKATAHKYYVSFLQQTGLWSHLGSSSSSGGGSCVRTALLENAQRLAFAAALRAKHQHHHLLVDHAIGEVIRERGVEVRGRLTPADVFYCRVSCVHEVVWGLMAAVRQIVDADVVPRDAPASLHTAATLLLHLVKAATAVTSAGGSPSSAPYSHPKREHIPWTASEGPKGIRTLLVQLHGYLVEVGIAHAEEAATRSSLYAALVELTDVILAGYQPQLNSLLSTDTSGAPVPSARFDGSFSSGGPVRFGREGGTVGAPTPLGDPTASHNPERYQLVLGEYQKLRYSLISPLAAGGQLSQALSLGEKYCDFRTLVEVCDASDDTARLNRYMVQFGGQGFSDFVFRWYLETGKRGRLLSYGGEGGARTADGGGEWAAHLASFLKGYSGLEWLHQLGTRDFTAAQHTLQQQALAETTYLARKKTLVSLSKLCRLAAGTSKDAQEDSEGSEAQGDGPQGATDPLLLEEELILYQEQLPPHVLAAHNLEPDTMRVLSPTQIIQLYTSEENTGATELDFKRALELLPFVPSLEESEELKLTIWVRAVLRDAWSDLDTDAPLDAISSTLLFRTIELAYTQGCPLQEMLVPVDALLAVDELQPLCQDPGFPFLIRAGYEKIEQLVRAAAA